MDITFTKPQSIKIIAKQLSVVINPQKPTEIDVTLFTKSTENWPAETKVFAGPGEYEVQGCMIDGIKITNDNTAYGIQADDINVSYIAGIKSTLSDPQIERFDGVDVLIIQVDQDNASLMNQIISQLEPKIIIPIMESQTELKTLVSEFGSTEESVEKLRISKKDLTEDSQKLVILESV